MSHSSDILILADICGQEWFLSIEFDYIPGNSGSAPSLSHPGEPPEPPEIYINKIEWARANQPLPTYIPQPDGTYKRNPAKPKPDAIWHELTGPLFDLLSEDEWIIDQICDQMADNEVGYDD